MVCCVVLFIHSTLYFGTVPYSKIKLLYIQTMNMNILCRPYTQVGLIVTVVFGEKPTLIGRLSLKAILKLDAFVIAAYSTETGELMHDYLQVGLVSDGLQTITPPWMIEHH